MSSLPTHAEADHALRVVLLDPAGGVEPVAQALAGVPAARVERGEGLPSGSGVVAVLVPPEIPVGRAECDAPRFRRDLEWKAELHGGIWDVWVGNRQCRFVHTKVIAANGKIAETCKMCVVVT